MSKSHLRSCGAFLLFLAPTLTFGQTMTRLSPPGFNSENPSADLRARLVIYTSGNALLIHVMKTAQLGLLAEEGVSEARISANGRFIAFSGDGDPVGRNADGNQEVFFYDWTNNLTIRQITDTAGGFVSSDPSVDKSGRWVAFLSDADLLGTNADGNEEVFLYNTREDTLIQVTRTAPGPANDDPILASTGKYLYFSSENDLVGTNGDGNAEIFRYVLKTLTIEQLTQTTNGDCERPRPNKNGKLVVFQSDSDQLAGANADGLEEIYRLDTRKGSVRRLTDNGFAAERPSVSGNGKVVTFESSGDPLGTNTDGSRELFRVRLGRLTLETTQLTDGSVGTESRRAFLDGAGKRIFFQSDADLTGEGAGEQHIFYFTR